MSYTVSKPFKTINRKFSAGDVIVAEDIDAGNVLSISDYVSRGFVADANAKPATPVSAPAGGFFKSAE